MLKDSWRLIPMKLAKMPSALGFKNTAGKEVMYYDMYNWETIGHIQRMTKRNDDIYRKARWPQPRPHKQTKGEIRTVFLRILLRNQHFLLGLSYHLSY